MTTKVKLKTTRLTTKIEIGSEFISFAASHPLREKTQTPGEPMRVLFTIHIHTSAFLHGIDWLITYTHFDFYAPNGAKLCIRHITPHKPHRTVFKSY